jgi:hypothetical protein
MILHSLLYYLGIGSEGHIGTPLSATSLRKSPGFVFKLVTTPKKYDYKSKAQDIGSFISAMETVSSQDALYSEDLLDRMVAIDALWKEDYISESEVLIKLKEQLTRISNIILDSAKNSSDVITQDQWQLVIVTTSIAIRTLQNLLIHSSESISEDYFVQCCGLLDLVFSEMINEAVHNGRLGIDTLNLHRLHELLDILGASLKNMRLTPSLIFVNTNLARTFVHACLLDPLMPLREELLNVLSGFIVQSCLNVNDVILSEKEAGLSSGLTAAAGALGITMWNILQQFQPDIEKLSTSYNAQFSFPFELLYRSLDLFICYSSKASIQQSSENSTIAMDQSLYYQDGTLIIQEFLKPLIFRILEKEDSTFQILRHLFYRALDISFSSQNIIGIWISRIIFQQLFNVCEPIKIQTSGSDSSEQIIRLLDIFSEFEQILLDVLCKNRSKNIRSDNSEASYLPVLFKRLFESVPKSLGLYIMCQELENYSKTHYACSEIIQSLVFEDRALSITPREYLTLNLDQELSLFLQNIHYSIIYPCIHTLGSFILTVTMNQAGNIRSKAIRGLHCLLNIVFQFNNDNLLLVKPEYPNKLGATIWQCIKYRTKDESGVVRDAAFEFIMKNHLLLSFGSNQRSMLFTFYDEICAHLSDSSVNVKKRCIKLLGELYRDKDCSHRERSFIFGLLFSRLGDSESTVKELSQSILLQCCKAHFCTFLSDSATEDRTGDACNFEMLTNIMYAHFSSTSQESLQLVFLKTFVKPLLSTADVDHDSDTDFSHAFMSYITEKSIIADLSSCCLLSSITKLFPESIKKEHCPLLLNTLIDQHEQLNRFISVQHGQEDGTISSEIGHKYQTMYHLLCIIQHILPATTIISRTVTLNLDRALFSMLSKYPEWMLESIIQLMGKMIGQELSSIAPVSALWDRFENILSRSIIYESKEQAFPPALISRSIYLASLLIRYIPWNDDIPGSANDAADDPICSGNVASKLRKICIWIPLYFSHTLLSTKEASMRGLQQILLYRPRLLLTDDSIKQVVSIALTLKNTGSVSYPSLCSLCLTLLHRIMLKIIDLVQRNSSLLDEDTITRNHESSSFDPANTESLGSFGVKDSKDPSSIAAAIAQIHTQNILKCLLVNVEPIQLQAIQLVNDLFNFGLLHPGIISPYYLFLEATHNPKLAHLSRPTLQLLRENHSAFVHSKLKDAIWFLFQYYSTYPSQYESLLQPYFLSVRSKRSLKFEFFRMLASFFVWGSASNLMQALTDLPFSAFILHAITALVFHTEDEPFFLLKSLYQTLLSSTQAVLSVLRTSSSKVAISKNAHIASQSLIWLNHSIHVIQESYSISDSAYASMSITFLDSKSTKVFERPISRLQNIHFDLSSSTLKDLEIDNLIDTLEDLLQDAHKSPSSDEDYSEERDQRVAKNPRSLPTKRISQRTKASRSKLQRSSKIVEDPLTSDSSDAEDPSADDR